MNAPPAGTTVHHAPSFAGGHLEFLNQVLEAVAKSRQIGTTPHLVLDANLLREADLQLAVQNAHGDVVVLPVPDHGKMGHGSAAKLRLLLEDLLPAVAELDSLLDLTLPTPGQTPLDAAAAWWQQLLPELHIHAIGFGVSPPAELLAGVARTDSMMRNHLWLSSRLVEVMQDFPLSALDLLAGENHCRLQLPRVPVGELEEELQILEKRQQESLARLKPLAAQVEDGLVGAWLRLRRDLAAATKAFAGSADRSGRNRLGTRGARLHALAQVAAPHGETQDQGLSLLSLAASHQWHPSRIEAYITSITTCEGPICLLQTD